MNPESVVIVRNRFGYTGHICYADPKKNVWISHAVKEQLHRLIARHFK